MARKPKFEGGTKEKLVECATNLFFEKGYDGTSIRSIVDVTGCEIGVFYYYYQSKDAIFNDVVDNFFKRYKEDIDYIIEQSKIHPMGGIGRVFVFITREAEKFKATYAEKMHKSIRIYMNEKALEKIEPCMRQVVENLIVAGAKPIMSANDAAKFLTHALGSLIIKSDTKWLEDNKCFIKAAVNHIMGLSEEEAKNMNELILKESKNQKF